MDKKYFRELISKVSVGVKSAWLELFVLAAVILIASISYNLGRIYALERTALKITDGANIYQAGAPMPEQGSAASAEMKPRDQRVMASKVSTSKKYHYSWCAGAKQIKPENQLWFSTAASAQQAGYTLAGNCQ